MGKLTNPETYVLWRRYNKTDDEYSDWKNMQWVKYSIKETDMRIKTMTFNSPDYIDLTQGRVHIKIICEGHENVQGVILSVDEDEDTGLWNYQCQDYNRLLNMKSHLYGANMGVYDTIKSVLDKLEMSALLEPIEYYHQQQYSDIQSFNPMEKRISAIYDKVPYGNIIRSLIFDNNVFADFYFPNELPVIEPYNRDEWLGKGIYISTPELASYNMKFDITNILTEVVVKSSEAMTKGKTYTSSDLLGVDLACFYGYMKTVIDNPVKENSNGGGLVNVSKETPILVNSDNINGKANDQKMIDDCIAGLKNKGYTNVIGGSINPDCKYHDMSKLADNGVMFWICGGICAGTIRDMASDYFIKQLNGKKMVCGFLAPPVDDDLDQLSYIGNAWDDNFSKGSNGLNNPGDFMVEHNLPYVYGSSGQQLADNFTNGGGGLAATVPGAKIDTNPNNLKPQNEWRNNNASATVTDSATTSDGSVTVDSNSASNVELEKQEALKVMTESVRDLLSFSMKIPGGNPIFKNLHTNSFLWTELPERMMLHNFKLTAEAMTGAYTRYAGYELNRWYIEGLTINHDNSGLWFDITLNPFASAYSTYTNILKTAQEAYVRATTKTGSDGGVFAGDISADVQEAANQIIGGATDPDTKAKLIFDWFDQNINYPANLYYNSKYTPSQVLSGKVANCWDSAHTLYDLWSAVGVKCNIQNGQANIGSWSGGHTWNQVEYQGRMVCCDAGTGTTGRWIDCKHIWESASILKKNY